MSDFAWDGGEELVFDRDDAIGEHTLDPKKGNIRVKEGGVEIEVDCPQCDYTRSLELDWRDVAFLAFGLPVRPLHVKRGGTGFQAYVVCEQCRERLHEQQDPKAKQHATTVLDLSRNEIKQWANEGKEGGYLTPGMIAKAQAAVQQRVGKRRRPVAAQPQPRARGIVRRRRRRRP